MSNIFQDYENSYTNIDKQMIELGINIDDIEISHKNQYNTIYDALNTDGYDNDEHNSIINLETKIIDIFNQMKSINEKLSADISFTDISSQLQDYTDKKTNLDKFINNIDETIYDDDIDDLVEEYNKLKQELQDLYKQYTNNIARLNSNKMSNNYYLMYIWLIIFCVLLGAAFISIVDTNSSMNSYVQFILFTVLGILLYNIIRNFYFYGLGHSFMMQ